jgi:hypothetical protein
MGSKDAMRRSSLVAGASLSAALVQAAAAQPPTCAERSRFLRDLATKYAEAPIAIGLATSGNVIELLKSSSGETWTIIVTMPNGTACLVASGKHWESLLNAANRKVGQIRFDSGPVSGELSY